MKKLVLILFALAFTFGIIGCKGGGAGNSGDGQEMVFECPNICEHLFNLMFQDTPEEAKKDLDQERDQIMKDCAADCKDFDEKAKKCLMDLKSFEGMKKCDEEAQARAGGSGEEEKKEEAK